MLRDDFDKLFHDACGEYRYIAKYDDCAKELYRMYMSFINAGFSADCSMELLLTIINAAMGGN